MKIYTYRPPTGARSSESELPPLAPGTSWVRFGEEAILYQDEESEQELATLAGRGAGLKQRRVVGTREELYVVVQNGRLFQQHHPDVPVIHDRGRFLLVQLDPERARELEGKNETCYGVMPLAENQVVFEEHEPAATRAPAVFVQDLVNKVMRTRLETNLTKLASFTTRHSTSKEFGKAAAWARKQLDEMNYKIRLQQVKVDGKLTRNIIAEKQGQGSKRKIVVVTAHLDSINLQGGPLAPAPGADDNGSGSAGLLEIARVFQDHNSKHDLRLILFGGEEEGLLGSKRYVASLTASERARIQAVINMDMIGALNSPSRSVLLEGAPLSQTVIDGLRQAAAAHTQLIVESSLNPFASDHVPFIKAGIQAVLTIEGADNTNSSIHSGQDTLDKIDYEIALEILRMNIAFVAGAIGNI